MFLWAMWNKSMYVSKKKYFHESKSYWYFTFSDFYPPNLNLYERLAEIAPNLIKKKFLISVCVVDFKISLSSILDFSIFFLLHSLFIC